MHDESSVRVQEVGAFSGCVRENWLHSYVVAYVQILSLVNNLSDFCGQILHVERFFNKTITVTS